METGRQVCKRRHPAALGGGAAAGREHVPVNQPRARVRAVDERSVAPLVLRRAHVFEDIRQVEPVEAALSRGREAAVDEAEAVQAVTDRAGMGRAQVGRQRFRRVRAGHDVREIRVGVCRERGERVPGACQEARAGRSLHVREERGIAAQAAHHHAAEEHPEQAAPAPGIPASVVEFDLLFH